MEHQHLKELELILLKLISLEKYKIVDNKLVFNFDLVQPLIANNEREFVKSLARIEKELGIRKHSINWWYTQGFPLNKLEKINELYNKFLGEIYEILIKNLTLQ